MIGKIPSDILKAAEACYLECEQMDSYGIIDTIGKAIATERMRCSQICEAELEWGNGIRDAIDSIDAGLPPRYIHGWSTPIPGMDDEE